MYVYIYVYILWTRHTGRDPLNSSRPRSRDMERTPSPVEVMMMWSSWTLRCYQPIGMPDPPMAQRSPPERHKRDPFPDTRTATCNPTFGPRRSSEMESCHPRSDMHCMATSPLQAGQDIGSEKSHSQNLVFMKTLYSRLVHNPKCIRQV